MTGTFWTESLNSTTPQMIAFWQNLDCCRESMQGNWSLEFLRIESSMQPSAVRRRGAEGCIDDSIRRNSKDQFPCIDSRQQSRFCQKAIICGVVEFKDSVQKVPVIREPGQHRGPALRVLRGNQSMRISLINWNGAWQGLSSTTTAIQQSTDGQHARHSTLD